MLAESTISGLLDEAFRGRPVVRCGNITKGLQDSYP